MGLIVVTKPGTLPTAAAYAGWEEAIAIAPPGFLDRTGEMLPTTPQRGACRICGEVSDLTREHIPPQSVGNSGQYRAFTFQDWLGRAEGQLDLGKGDPGQGGVWGFTLCKPCNELTGQRYVPEYKAWSIRAAQILHQAPSPRERDLIPEPLGLSFRFGGVEDGGVAPGDFVRQVLAMMCSLGGSWDLTTRYPVLRRMIIDRECAPMPDRMRIFLAFCWGPRSRLIGPQLIVDSVTGEWAWIMEMTYAPLSLMMVIDANHEPISQGVDISHFTMVAPMERGKYEVPDPIIAGFTWSLHPWDFRSSAALGVPSPIPPE